MNSKLKVLVTFLVLVGIILIFYFGTKMITKVAGKSIISFDWLIKDINTLEDFAKCLTEKEVKMYGGFWCGHCQNQKKKFGDAWDFVNYVECDARGENAQVDLCIAKGIGGYPTWEINGKLYPGEMTLERLAELSWCKLNN